MPTTDRPPLRTAPDGRPLDVTGLPLTPRDVDLRTFLHPTSVAAIGASETPGTPTTIMTNTIKAFADRVGASFHPVHPTRESVLGVPCVTDIADVPGPVDLVVVLNAAAVDSFERVVAARAKFAVIFAAGFSETGDRAGEALQARLEALVAQGPTHLMGPNTNLNAFSEFRDLPGRSIALITQSGHQGRPVFQGQEIGIRLSHWAPTGNEVDLEFADFARYFADLPEVGVVAAYIEGFADGRSMMLAADHAARAGVPLVVVKVGRTEAGRATAQAHTGHLAGSDAVTSAVFDQFGVHRVDGLDELLEVSAMFARTEAPTRKGEGVVVYSVSGGTSAHMADLAAAAGLHLPALSRATQATLHDGLIAPFLRVSNPVDCGGPPVADWRGRKILDAIVADPKVAAVIVPITGVVEIFSEGLTRDIIDVARESGVPFFVVWGAPPGTDDTYYFRLLDAGLPVFRTFRNCVTAVKAYFDHWAFVRRYRSPFPAAPTAPLPAARKARAILARTEPGGTVAEHDAKAVLRAYGIRTSRDALCTSAAEAVRAAKAIGYPVVMKAAAGALAHKSDLGLVRLDVASDREVRETYADLERRARRALGRTGELDGILVCDQVDDGVEVVVGVTRDPLFGPVVMAGLGGVLVEVLRDVTFRVPPFGPDEARRMLEGLRGYPLLTGVRGSTPVDVDAVVDVIMKVQRLAQDLADDVAELDVNPLRVRRKGAVALDALIVRA